MIFCPACGSQNDNNTRFCLTCGSVMNMNYAPKLPIIPVETADPDMTFDAHVTGASVSFDGARLECAGTAHLKAGHNRLFIDGIDRSILSPTIRFHIKGCTSRYDSPMSISLEKTGEADSRKKELERQISILTLQEELLKKNGDFSARNNVSLEDGLRYLEELPEKLQALSEKKDVLQAEFDELNNNPSAFQHYVLPVDAECPADGDYNFSLSYTTSGPRWFPFYEIYAEEKGKLTLQLKGTIRQNMFSDWSNCHLTLCAGKVTTGGDLPVLYPFVYYGNSAQIAGKAYSSGHMMPAGMKSRAATNGDTAILDMAMDAEPMMMASFEEPPMETFSSSMKSENIVKYEIPGNITIPHGDNGTILGIQTTEITGTYTYESVPKLEETAYLMAKTGDLKELHLLACEAHLYLKDSYAGRIFLTVDNNDANVSLPLGADERIMVSRKELEVFHTKKALFSNSQTQSHKYEIKVENRSEDTITLLIHDQIPISRSSEITVEAQLGEGVLDKNTGEVTWTLSLSAGEKKAITFEYSVTWPKGSVLR